MLYTHGEDAVPGKVRTGVHGHGIPRELRGGSVTGCRVGDGVFRE